MPVITLALKIVFLSAELLKSVTMKTHSFKKKNSDDIMRVQVLSRHPVKCHHVTKAKLSD